MRSPYRKPPARMTPAQIDDLVARRDAGATWKDVGRVFRLQDERAKEIYTRAVASRPIMQPISATGGHMDAGALGE